MPCGALCSCERARVAGRRAWPDPAERIWPESNCYIDLWISVLRDLSLEPEAMLACTVAPRFEGDQWTFCKPTATELAELYGLRVEELTIWRSLREHVAVQLELGRLVLVEVDAFHLPDTAGVSYRSAHQKTTIGIVALDEANRRLDYYHNAGRFELSGERARRRVELTGPRRGPPPFAELVDSSRVGATRSDLLRERSRAIAARRLAGVGTSNPFAAWAARAAHDMAQLRANDLEFFHAWAFASVRQAGAMAEHLATLVRLGGRRSGDRPGSRVAANGRPDAEGAAVPPGAPAAGRHGGSRGGTGALCAGVERCAGRDRTAVQSTR